MRDARWEGAALRMVETSRGAQAVAFRIRQQQQPSEQTVIRYQSARGLNGEEFAHFELHVGDVSVKSLICRICSN